MDFQSVNPLNVWLNLLSGNLLPMTTDGTSYSILWKIHSVFVWLVTALQAVTLAAGCILAPKEKALKDGVIVLVIIVEVVFMATQIHARRRLVSELIETLNKILRLEDEMIKDIVMAVLRPIQIPLKLYWMLGIASLIVWTSTPFLLIFKKDYFFYVDYRMPVFYAKEPVSTNIFILGSFIVMISCVYLFTKKASLDSYMIHMMLLLTAQYKYIGSKLSKIFQDGIARNDSSKENHSNVDYYVEKEIKFLCQHHKLTMRIMLMMKNLLSLNLCLIHINSIFRFCFMGTLILSFSSMGTLDISMIILYTFGIMIQLYILCYCVQQLLDASVGITDNAFHKEWYRYGKTVKRTFMMLIMANDLDCKLSTFENLNLSLPSLMKILNSSYSIALLFSKTL